LGVTQAHLFLGCEPSSKNSETPSATTDFGFEVNCLLRLVIQFVLHILPGEARLRNESEDASEEQETVSDKLECNND
ncbi:hypothetical protein, partial [Klebsiella pneumoniae]|uniref:hypothetical protein n=1 Tax=Klebsiella pneumoniae TaxID=573 RepID=UPI0030140CA9